MLQAADYTNLSDGLYEIAFGSVLGRRIGYQGGFTDLGDVEMFTLNITPTRKQRWSKKGKRANLAKEVTTRLEAVITAKFMQKTGLIRGAAMMGKVLDVVQAPGVIPAEPVMLRAGEYLYLGSYNISLPVVQYTAGNALKALDTTRAATWWVDAVGSVTIQILDAEPPDFLDEFVEEPKQAELITVWIVRNKGATISWPADWQWSSEIRGGSIGSDNPFSGATQDAQIDCYTVMRVPDRGVFAFVSGRKFS